MHQPIAPVKTTIRIALTIPAVAKNMTPCIRPKIMLCNALPVANPILPDSLFNRNPLTRKAAMIPITHIIV